MSAVMNRGYKGRGVSSNRSGRFNQWRTEKTDDGWHQSADAKLKTHVNAECCRTALTSNQSPDLPFEHSINMYRGCEHGCSYCYARPSHTYLGYSAGLDFETRLIAKPNVAVQLKKEITARSYQCKVIALGTNTDPYQPIEKHWQLTHQILKVLLQHRHPVTLTTKSASILQDLNVLTKLAELNLVNVNISITTLDPELSRRMEPRASAPHSRLKAVKKLADAAIPVTIFYAPVIPGLNEHELESILEQSAQAGANRAEYIMIRLPQEVGQLFQEWLEFHYPNKSTKVLNLIRQLHGGEKNSTKYFERMRGSGLIADLIQKRFLLAAQKFGLNLSPVQLDHSRFRKDCSELTQLSLF